MAALSDYTTSTNGLREPYVTATARVEQESDSADDDKILRGAQDRFRQCLSWENDWRRKAQEELDFADHLEHWDTAMRIERKGRPCLTFDKITPAINQVLNDARQNPSAPKFFPVGGGADRWTAEIIEGLVRNIENDSVADVAYMTGYRYAVKIGRGWWRVLFEFENDATFQQKIVIKAVPNPFSVYPDPSSDKHDYSDMRFAFVTENMDRKAYRERYPDSEVASLENFEGVGDPIKRDWFPEGMVRIAEYWWVEKNIERLYLLPNGESVTEVPEGAEPIASRDTERNRVFCAKLNGREVLEKYEWPGKTIPLVPVIGDESIKNGRRTLTGMIRRSMDANLSYDYMRSKEVEVIGLTPIAPMIVAEGSLENQEARWADSNRKPYPYLEYKMKVAGEPVPPPMRLPYTPDIGPIVQAIAHADNDIKSTTSIYDASLGSPGPETSGRAILARQREGDNAHFHYHDNLALSKRRTGELILELAPHVYTEERALMINDPDGSSREIKINGPMVVAGEQRLYSLNNTAARYHVVIGSGPSFPTRQLMGSEAMVELMRTNPAIASRIGDLYVRSLDIPYGEQIASRLQPPDAAPSDDPEARYQQMNAQLHQTMTINQQLTQALQSATSAVEKERMKLASQERIAYAGDETQLRIASAKLGGDMAMHQLEMDVESLKQMIAALQAAQPAPQQSPS